MKPERILQSDVLDILFENRNKDYGAYELRKQYNRRLKKAMFITTALVLVLAGLQSWKMPHKTIHIISVHDLNPINLVDVQLKKEEPQPMPKQEKKIATVDYQNYQIVKDKLVVDTLPTIEDLEDKIISDKNTDGDKVAANTILSPANDGDNKGVTIAEKVEEKDDVPLKHAEIMPQFPGGMEAFLKYMQRNLKQPEDFDEGQKMIVMASFIVEASGNIADIAIDRKARPDLDAEVMRVLKNMPQWEPGMQNGRKVPVFYRLPVTFIAGE